MADEVSFKITGTEELAKVLETKPAIVAQRIIRQSLREAVRAWREEMIARVRKGWHVFARTKIKGQRGTLAGREREYGVISNSIAISSEIGAGGFEGTAAVHPTKRAFWSRFLEFGTRKMPAYPFIRPAFESRKEEVLEKFVEDVRDQLREGMGLK